MPFGSLRSGRLTTQGNRLANSIVQRHCLQVRVRRLVGRQSTSTNVTYCLCNFATLIIITSGQLCAALQSNSAVRGCRRSRQHTYSLQLLPLD